MSSNSLPGRSAAARRLVSLLSAGSALAAAPAAPVVHGAQAAPDAAPTESAAHAPAASAAPAPAASSTSAIADAAPSPGSAAAAAASAAAAHETVTLAPYVVSAMRMPTDPRVTPSVVTALSPADLALRQTPDLAAALAQVPGVNVARTGALGGPASVFIRGAANEQTLWLVDGIRMSSAETGFNNFIGAADTAGVGRLEVLRGPQSTLYGSSAVGGVILIDTVAGCGPASGVVSAEAGSFGTVGASAAAQGGTARLGYSASLSHLSTENDRAYNDYARLAYTGRLEFAATPRLLVGVTLRGQDVDAEAPGAVGSTFAGDTEATHHLATAYAQLSPAETLRSRLTYGWVQQEYVYDPFPPPVGNAFDTDFYSRDTRNVLDWQNTWEPADTFALVAGLNGETERVTTTDPFTVNRFDNDSRAAYASAQLRPLESVTLLGGLRRDDYDQFGGATTWRTGASWITAERGPKLRANYGTGFNAPRPVFVIGGPFYSPNPGLRPEESEGWDLGFDQVLRRDVATLAVTYFKNEFTNLFVYDFTVPGILNAGRARAEGVETALALTPAAGVKIDLAHTYLEARNETRGVPLVRRPRHAFDAQATWQVARPWLLGAGMHVAARRFDGSTNAPVRVEDYTTLRVFTAYEFSPGLVAKLRVENALDENYADVRNYPALPLGVHGGLEWRF